jgi:hypothetical protein
MAARTFFEMRWGGPAILGGGLSSTAKAPLAGVMFSMCATVGCSGPAATHRRVTFRIAPQRRSLEAGLP